MERLRSEDLERLEHRIRIIIRVLKSTNEFRIHQNINLFYYMQKAEELRILNETVLEKKSLKCDALQDTICKLYKEIYYAWRSDIRWLNRHLHAIPLTETS